MVLVPGSFEWECGERYYKASRLSPGPTLNFSRNLVLDHVFSAMQFPQLLRLCSKDIRPLA